MNDGGPAYPVNGPNGDHPGMSLRDRFAIAIAAGALANGNWEGISKVMDEAEGMKFFADGVWSVADAMLKARESP